MTIDVLKALPQDPKRNAVAPSSVAARPSVRRSLFGEVDHEESMRFLKKELDAINHSPKERWNFDFVNERPTDETSGNYEWQRVQQNEVIPRPYALSRLPYLFENAAQITEKCGAADSPVVADAFELRLCDNKVTCCKRKLTQTTIPGKIG